MDRVEGKIDMSIGASSAIVVPLTGEQAHARDLSFTLLKLQYPELLREAVDEFCAVPPRSEAAVQASWKADFLLRYEASPNTITSDGMPVLAKAVQKNWPWLFDRLLKEHYINVDLATHPHRPNALSLAILTGNAIAVNKLLARKAQVTEQTLAWAAGCGRLGILEKLETALEESGHPIAPAEKERLQTHAQAQHRLAMVFGHLTPQELDLQLVIDSARGLLNDSLVLLSLGANPNAADAFGLSGLHKAVSAGAPETVKALLKAGANPNTIDWFEVSPLHKAAHLANPEIMKILLSAGADKEMQDKFGLAALHVAVSLGHTQTVQSLIDAGANLQATNSVDDTPLHLAAAAGHLDIVKALIKAGAKLDAKNQEGETVLHSAINSRDLELMAEILNARKQLLNVTSGKGETPLYQAIMQENAPMVRTLLGAGADPNIANQNGDHALHQGFWFQYWEMSHSPIDRGGGKSTLERKGTTPLYKAVTLKNLEIVRALLAAGANPQTGDSFGNTPLHMACLSKDPTIFHLLLRNRQVDPDVRNWYGKTPLLLAAQSRNPSFAKKLLALKVNPNTADWEGLTPLHLAAQWGHPETVQALLEVGADMTARTNLGKTPLDWANKQNGIILQLAEAMATELTSNVTGASS